MNVGSTSSVVTGENGGELRETVGVCGPGGAEPGLNLVPAGELGEETLANAIRSGSLPVEVGVGVSVTGVVTCEA